MGPEVDLRVTQTQAEQSCPFQSSDLFLSFENVRAELAVQDFEVALFEGEKRPERRDVVSVTSDICKDSVLKKEHVAAFQRAVNANGVVGVYDLVQELNKELKSKGSKCKFKLGWLPDQDGDPVVPAVFLVDTKGARCKTAMMFTDKFRKAALTEVRPLRKSFNQRENVKKARNCYGL